MSNYTHLRALALGATALALLSGPMASDALAIHADDTPEWAAPAGVFVEPEAVFMQFSDSNTEFAAIYDGGATDIARIDGDYEVGWRFGIGYRWANRWSVALRWTSIDGNEHDSASAKDGIENLLAYDFDPTADGVTARVDRDLDIFDFEVGRTFGDVDGHHMKIFFGPRYMTYEQRTEAMAWDAAMVLNWGGQDQDVDAWGVRVGIEGHVALGHETGWSFFGYAAASGLVTNTDWADAAAYGEADVLAEDWAWVEYDSTDGHSLGLEAGLGFQWSHTFDSDWNFGIKFGWEVSNYTDLAGGGPWQSAAGSDDLGLDGGFVRFMFTW